MMISSGALVCVRCIGVKIAAEIYAANRKLPYRLLENHANRR